MREIRKLIVKENSVGICWIGQGGFVFKTPREKVIFVDPYLSNIVEKHDGLRRLQEIPIEPRNAVCNLVLCTHDHLDHTDPETLLGISEACEAKFGGPSSSCRHMEKLGIDKNRLIQINRGETKIIEDIRISAVYAKHTEDSVGYVLNFNNISVYLTGDTEYDVKLREIRSYRPDVILICINGKWGNMNIEEAVKLTGEIQPKMVMSMHYGMFKENTANPQEFIQLLKKSNTASEGVVLDYGKPFLYVSY